MCLFFFLSTSLIVDLKIETSIGIIAIETHFDVSFYLTEKNVFSTFKFKCHVNNDDKLIHMFDA